MLLLLCIPIRRRAEKEGKKAELKVVEAELQQFEKVGGWVHACVHVCSQRGRWAAEVCPACAGRCLPSPSRRGQLCSACTCPAVPEVCPPGSAALQERAAQQQKRAVEVAKLRTEREAQLEEQVGSGWGRWYVARGQQCCSTASMRRQ